MVVACTCLACHIFGSKMQTRSSGGSTARPHIYIYHRYISTIKQLNLQHPGSHKSWNQLSLLKMSGLTIIDLPVVLFTNEILSFRDQKRKKEFNQNHYLKQLVCCISCHDGYCTDLVIFKHPGKLSTQQLQWAYYNCEFVMPCFT